MERASIIEKLTSESNPDGGEGSSENFVITLRTRL
jgi:hypothetical protein